MLNRHLHVLGATGQSRVEHYDGREHLVVPVVALMEGVIHAVNAATPEFVPFSTLQQAANSWNGRPLVLGHPARGGQQVSANDARVLESQSFGTIFNARVSGKRLLMDAYIDPVKAEKIGAGRMLAALRNGEMVEVSVGAFVNADAELGNFNGKAYKARWSSAAGDHLAFLPGGRGACSIEMGCGAMRAAGEAPVVHEIVEDEMRVAGDLPGHEFHGNQYTGASGAVGGKKGDNFVKEAHQDKGSVLDRKGQPLPFAAERQFKKPEDSKALFEQAHAALEKQGYKPDNPTSPDFTSWRDHTATFTHPETGATARLSKTVVTPYSHSTDKVRFEKSEYNVSVKLKREAARGLASFGDTMHNLLTPLLARLRPRHAALYDTPEQAASEEAAELVGYEAVQSLLNNVSESLDAAVSLAGELISDETKDPTETAAQEVAEEEVETARLQAISTHIYAMIGVLGAVNQIVSQLQAPELPMPSDPRYAEALRALIGARNSKTDASTIQAAHDAAHTVHDHTTALGASCESGMKAAANKMKDCTACDGSGSLKGNPCEACDGTGQLKTAEHNGGGSAEGDDMKKTELIKALTACPCSGFTEKDAAFLETATEAQLEGFKAAAEARSAELKTLKDANEKKDADLRAAQTRTLTEAEFEAAAPAELKTLIENAKKQDTARRSILIDKLKTLGAYTEAELNETPTASLEKLATLAKIDAPVVDFSGRLTTPEPRGAASIDAALVPQDGYQAGIAALRAAQGK